MRYANLSVIILLRKKERAGLFICISKMLEKIIKKTLSYGGALLLGLTFSCDESDTKSYKPIINNVSYTSNSHENSLNHWFVSGEDINVYVSLNENIDSAYIDAERIFRNNSVRESYNMSRDVYGFRGTIPKFDDGGVLRFKVVVYQGKRIESSSTKEEGVFISEGDAHGIIKNWLDSRSTEFCITGYNQNEIIDYGLIILNADFNLKNIECFTLTKDAIIEYVGENDVYEFSLDERVYLNNNGIGNRYIYNLLVPGVYWGQIQNEVTNKQDLENYVSNFYYGLY